MSQKLSPNDAKWVADARAQFIERVDGKEIATLKLALAAKEREIARLEELVAFYRKAFPTEADMAQRAALKGSGS
jgi:hypothetical protein